MERIVRQMSSALILSKYLKSILILSSNLNPPNSIFLLGHPSTNFVRIYLPYHAYLCNFEYIDQGGASAVIFRFAFWIFQIRIPAKLVTILRSSARLLFPDKEGNTLKHAQIATSLHLLILVMSFAGT